MANGITDVDLTGRSGMVSPATETTANNGGEPFRIVVKEHEKFDNIIKSSLMSTHQFMDMVSELFSAVYKDFAGCFITPKPNGVGFDTKLYFTTPAVDNGGVQFAFTESKNEIGTDLLSRVSNLSTINTRRSNFTLSKYGLEGLEEFIQKDNNGRFDWKQHLAEDFQRNPMGGGTLYAVVLGLDITRLVSKIYGSTDEDGNRVIYNVSPCRPIGQTMVNNVGQSQVIPSDWLISIQQLNMKALEDAQRAAGYLVTTGIPMVGRK